MRDRARRRLFAVATPVATPSRSRRSSKRASLASQKRGRLWDTSLSIKFPSCLAEDREAVAVDRCKISPFGAASHRRWRIDGGAGVDGGSKSNSLDIAPGLLCEDREAVGLESTRLK